VTRLRFGGQGLDSQQGLGIFLLATASPPAVRPIQPHIE